MNLDQSEKAQLQSMLANETANFNDFLTSPIKQLQPDHFDALFIGKLAEMCLYLFGLGQYPKDYFLSDKDVRECLFQTMADELEDDLFMKIRDHFNN